MFLDRILKIHLPTIHNFFIIQVNVLFSQKVAYSYNTCYLFVNKLFMVN